MRDLRGETRSIFLTRQKPGKHPTWTKSLRMVGLMVDRLRAAIDVIAHSLKSPPNFCSDNRKQQLLSTVVVPITTARLR